MASIMRYFQLISKRDLDPDPEPPAAFNYDHHEDQLVKLQEKVFQSPVILEVILTHILQKSGPTGRYLCTREARELRLVSKTWLIQINFLFQRHGEPLVFLNERSLKQFLQISDTCYWGTPSTCLTLRPRALLSQDFCEDLSKFFNIDYLVAKLTNLRISDPHTFKMKKVDDAVIGLPDFPTHFKLVNLRKIWLIQLKLKPRGKWRIPRLEEFLRQVLEKSEILEVFKFDGEVWPGCPPGQYEGLVLPGTVTRLQLDTRMDLRKMLGGVILEGITVLKLKVTTRNLIGRGELEGILAGMRMSLEVLELSFGYVEGLESVEVWLKIPVMESLKMLRFGGKEWRMDRSQAFNGLGGRLLLLEHLEVYGLTDEQLLRDWCGDNSVFGKVKTLTLKLETVEMGVDKMGRILKAFPNVEKLRLEGLNVGNLEGVRFMFGELGGQLRSLQLEFTGFLEREEDMEGILIGGDVEMVRRLKSWRWTMDGGKMWKEFLEGGNGEYKSLRDLVNLEELVLVVHAWRVFQNEWFWRLMRRPNMLSFRFGCEVLFEGAFMRMPNLRRLVLRGGLRPGEGIVEKWKKQGGGGGRREVEFTKSGGICDRLWEMSSWRWYILWVICWALVIFWKDEGMIREEPRNNTEEVDDMIENLLNWTI